MRDKYYRTRKEFRKLKKEYECIDCCGFDICFNKGADLFTSTKLKLKICKYFRGTCSTCRFYDDPHCEEGIKEIVNNPCDCSCQFWLCKHFDCED